MTKTDANTPAISRERADELIKALTPNFFPQRFAPLPDVTLSGEDARDIRAVLRAVVEDYAARQDKCERCPFGTMLKEYAEDDEQDKEDKSVAVQTRLGHVGATPTPGSMTVEALAEAFHNVYQAEAKRQGDVRHKDAYAELPENIKEYDRALARHVLMMFTPCSTADDIDGEEFYNLMQRYRHAPIHMERMVVEAYNDVLSYLRSRLSSPPQLKVTMEWVNKWAIEMALEGVDRTYDDIIYLMLRSIGIEVSA